MRTGLTLSVYTCFEYVSSTRLQVHLFDIDIPGKQYFKESDVLSPGNKLLSFDTGKLINRHYLASSWYIELYVSFLIIIQTGVRLE